MLKSHLVGFVLVLVAFVLIIVSISTDYWVKLTDGSGSGAYVNMGLWRACVSAYGVTACGKFDPVEDFIIGARVFMILGCLGIVMGVIPVVYYHWKSTPSARGAKIGAVVIALTCLMIIPGTIWYIEKAISGFDDTVPDAHLEIGYSVIIAWLTAAIVLISGGLLCSSPQCSIESQYNRFFNA